MAFRHSQMSLFSCFFIISVIPFLDFEWISLWCHYDVIMSLWWPMKDHPKFIAFITQETKYLKL